MGGPLSNVSIGQLIKDFGSNLWQEVKDVSSAVANFFTKFFDVSSRIESSVEEIVTKIEALKLNVETEIQQLKDFQFDPKWKTRVINVPAAIDQVRNFVTNVPKDIIDKFKSLAEDLANLVAGLRDTAGTIGGVDVQGTTGTGLIKVATWLEVLQEIFDRIVQFIDDLQVIVDDIKAITTQLETLDALFLQQGNPRIRIKGTISARDGKNRKRA